MIRANYHTHTTYCDGKDSPEEMVEAALALGMEELGFSGHSYLAFEPGWCMSRSVTQTYISEIRALQKRYEGRIRILLGIEQDFYSPDPTDEFDYVIGSVHFVEKNGVYWPIDKSADDLRFAAEQAFDGDIYALVEAYYENVSQVYQATHCDIIGHFDLITKFQEQQPLFDTEHPRYRAAADRALFALAQMPAVFEYNTGAIARGYRTTPYPEKRIRKWLIEQGHTLRYSSDCHNKAYLLCGWPMQEQDGLV